MTFTPRQAAAWNAIQAIPRPDGEPHLAMLTTLATVRDIADRIERATVADMRAHDWTWAEVGDAYGITHQAARQRWKGRGID